MGRGCQEYERREYSRRDWRYLLTGFDVKETTTLTLAQCSSSLAEDTLDKVPAEKENHPR